MYFRLSQKLAKKIKEDWPLQSLEANANPLADWSANLFTAKGSQYIILCHTSSLYSCLFYGRGITDSNRFIKAALQAIRDTIENDGLEETYLEKIVPTTEIIHFSKSLNRSVTGSITEQIHHAKSFIESRDLAPWEVTEKLNDNYLSILKYQRPKKAFLQLCQDGEAHQTPPQLPDPLPPNVLKFERRPEDARSDDEKNWQKLARTFSHIEHLARFDRLPPDFYPEHAIQLCEEAISTHERSILSFLLHVWNHYDYPFDLSEVAGWSDQHQIAFSNWVSGHTLGTRCRYF